MTRHMAMLAALCVAAALPAAAQEYPSKPVRIVARIRGTAPKS